MAGYNWNQGKSNNAVKAEKDGLLVASQFAAWVRKVGGRRFAGCTPADVRHVLVEAEWHHTSKMFNRVNYYDPRSLLAIEHREALAAAIATRKAVTRLVKEHQSRGLRNVLTPEGKEWHPLSSIDGDRVYSSLYLERLQASLAAA